MATLAGLILTLPALRIGWQLDDILHRVAFLELPGVLVPPARVFSFVTGDPASTRELVEQGIFPWWAVEDLRLKFWRPISVFTHWLDYRLWPMSAPLMHVHSLVWLGLAVFAVGVLYRRLIGVAWIAGLAIMLFALDDAHAHPAAWLANRSALVALTFGTMSLVMHDKWRRTGWQPGVWVSPLCLGLALASAEFGAGALAYLISYTFFVESGGWRKRSMALAPHAAVLLGYAVFYQQLGYGTEGSGFYVDPLREPLAFIGVLFERAPILLAGQWGPLPADGYGSLDGAEAVALWGASVGLLTLLSVALVPLIRASHTARFWAGGMALSLVPIAATAPSNRLLLFVGIGSMALLAEWLTGLLSRSAWTPSSRIWRAFAWTLVAVLVPVHLVVASLLRPLSTHAVAVVGEPVKAAVASIPTDRLLREQDLVIVNTPDHFLFVSHITAVKQLEGHPIPRRVRGLIGAPVAIALTRIDPHSLRARMDDGLMKGGLGALFRGPNSPLKIGDQIALEGMTVRIEALTADQRPRVVVFRFDRTLEDPSLRWLSWRDGVFVPFTPPRLGETIRLPRTVGPLDMPPAEMVENYLKLPTR